MGFRVLGPNIGSGLTVRDFGKGLGGVFRISAWVVDLGYIVSSGFRVWCLRLRDAPTRCPLSAWGEWQQKQHNMLSTCLYQKC